MRITGNWIEAHGVLAAFPDRETKTPTLAADGSVESRDWRDALPYWTGFAALTTVIVGLDVFMVWALGPR